LIYKVTADRKKVRTVWQHIAITFFLH